MSDVWSLPGLVKQLQATTSFEEVIATCLEILQIMITIRGSRWPMQYIQTQWEAVEDAQMTVTAEQYVDIMKGAVDVFLQSLLPKERNAFVLYEHSTSDAELFKQFADEFSLSKILFKPLKSRVKRKYTTQRCPKLFKRLCDPGDAILIGVLSCDADVTNDTADGAESIADNGDGKQLLLDDDIR
eukprot:TRINITY_DN5273_c0_g1_i3.p3 TRINITY_DN5273_c0_g1~~TRINITY_DN5273_c0_g1_i3.p3  ORF type:complete len:185 (-),score=49.39 TRINITY_DN5273_c0_g1_i3:107-661(-)